MRCEARPPKTFRRSTCLRELIVTICLICQSGCIGISLYALETSAFHKIKSASGSSLHIRCSAFPKSCTLSRVTPAISSFVIILLRAYCLALWSVTRRNLLVPGFGTAWIGMLYMPGIKSGLNEGEYLSFSTSFWTCSQRKIASDSVLGVC